MNNSNTNKRGKRDYKGKSQKEFKRSSRNTEKDYDREASNYAANNRCNDPSWYVPTDQNLKDVANLSYNNPIGLKNNNEGDYTIFYNGGYSHANRVSGVASIELMPTIGNVSDETSPVNIAALNLYSAIRRANSGAKNYDAPDLMSVILSVASAYSAISWLMRLYGYANVYSSQNRYVPKALIEANGVNFESILNNMNDFRTRINLLVLQLNAIYVPKGMPIFDRWFHMYEKCYADSATPQAQIYQYVPAGFLLRDDTTGDLSLVRIPYSQTGELTDYSELIEYVRTFINNLLYSEDVGTISGDVIKAFSETGVYTAPMLPENYAVIPDLSDEIRTQFENAVILGVDWNKSSFAITQDDTKSYLKTSYVLSIERQVGGSTGGKFINFHKNEITPEDTIVATRLAAVYDCVYNSNNEWSASLISFGSEIATNCTISTYSNNQEGKVTIQKTYLYSHLIVPSAYSSVSLDAASILDKLQTMSAFDWFPEVRLDYQTAEVAVGNNANIVMQYGGSVLDYDRGTYVDSYRLYLMHETALFGEFGVPR